jgi:hypothetical protein
MYKSLNRSLMSNKLIWRAGKNLVGLLLDRSGLISQIVWTRDQISTGWVIYLEGMYWRFLPLILKCARAIWPRQLETWGSSLPSTSKRGSYCRMRQCKALTLWAQQVSSRIQRGRMVLTKARCSTSHLHDLILSKLHFNWSAFQQTLSNSQ